MKHAELFLTGKERISRRLLQQALGLTLTMLLLAGCGGAPAEPTATPVPITATPKPILTPTPTPTPMPTITPAILPQAGATFLGLLEADKPGENATAGMEDFEFTITNDGAGIGTLGYSFSYMRCSNESKSISIETGAGKSTTTLNTPISIANGKFEYEFATFYVTGEFTSPTEAKGTIAISTNENVAPGNTLTCDYGTWTWIASAK